MVDWLTEKIGDFMRSINGRYRKAEKAESEELVGKPYKCERCKYIEFRKHVEFGEEPRCPDCGAILKELIYW